MIIFRKGGYIAERERWVLANKEVEIVNNYKYLGLILTTKLSMQTALTEFVGRAKKRVLDIHKLIHSIGYMSPMIYFKLIDSIVAPLALYCSEVWGIRDFSNIDSINLYACKRLLGVTKKTPNCLIYSELGRYPLSMYASLRAVKYWLKIMCMEEERLPKLAYQRECLEANKKNSWSKGIQSILELNGFGFVWINQGTNNINAFMRNLEQRMKDIYHQTWHDKCINSDRCAVYISFKNEFVSEPYINVININKFRTAMARLRVGASELNSNKKFIKSNASLKCPFCTCEETELHFLKYCLNYAELRTKYLGRHFKWNPNVGLKQILGSEDTRVIKDVATFIFHAFNKRKNDIQHRSETANTQGQRLITEFRTISVN